MLYGELPCTARGSRGFDPREKSQETNWRCPLAIDRTNVEDGHMEDASPPLPRVQAQRDRASKGSTQGREPEGEA